MKTCVACLENKPASEFHKNKRAPDGLCSTCKLCATERARLWRLANPERSRANARAAYERDPDRIKAQAAAWAKANRERRREIVAGWSSRNNEARTAAAARRRAQRLEETPDALRSLWRKHAQEFAERNPDRAKFFRDRTRARRLARDPDRIRMISRMGAAIRRARRRASEIEPVDFAAIMERDRMTCYLCGDPVNKPDLHFDHVVPLSKGGPHIAENLRVTHALCNLRKGSKLLTEIVEL